MTTATTCSLIIDIATSDVSKMIKRLKGLVSTLAASNGGEYREDNGFSQIRLESTRTEKEVDDWLYSTKGMNYIGVVER